LIVFASIDLKCIRIPFHHILISQDIVDDIKATPQRLLDAAILKAAETAADIRKIPDTAISKAQTAYNAKKLEITSTIDKNVKSLQSAVDSVIPSDDRKAI
jgi:hypothetical protein